MLEISVNSKRGWPVVRAVGESANDLEWEKLVEEVKAVDAIAVSVHLKC